MCEANVYLKEKDDEEYQLLMESVDKVIPNGEEIILESIFGQRKTVKARIKEMVLVDHKIMLDRIS
ncbi:MAG: CooT family nickel-binding protein [Bacillota bacterium]|nr:CooT family nickel-binding protein [Bacillota bacterium]